MSGSAFRERLIDEFTCSGTCKFPAARDAMVALMKSFLQTAMVIEQVCPDHPFRRRALDELMISKKLAEMSLAIEDDKKIKEKKKYGEKIPDGKKANE